MSSKPPVLSASPTPLPPSPGDVSVVLADGVTLVRPGGALWQPHPLWKGTSVKLLAHDADTGDFTAIVRLSKGSALPSRRHVSHEEMWMIEGVAIVGGIEMNAGEYSRSDPGAVHPKIVSTGGCTFLLRGNENDEILSEGKR
jgi:anti-sigma factor ChrR (cupin superfamily)